jgi:cytochrome c peroxidase
VLTSSHTRRIALASLVAILTGLGALYRVTHDSPDHDTAGVTRQTEHLGAAYARWKAALASRGEDRTLVLPLAWSKALSVSRTGARGQAALDLVDGSVVVDVSGLPETGAFDVWLIDNRPGPGRSVRPEPSDGAIRVGRLNSSGGAATLRARLDRDALSGFRLDLVVVARAGESPGTGGVLFGSPSLFQRLYHSERRGEIGPGGDGLPAAATPSLAAAPFRFLVPGPAYADPPGDIPARLAALIANGERLFFNETFEGNGRACGTCHRAENNFTIDAKFIATLPPDDPLFVAEFTPDLAVDFENPTLMRQSGLILENLDGFDKPGVMRGVPHTLGLITSLTKDATLPAGPPSEMTGWSGDGSPGGTLRTFAIGAVTQHFTKTLNRVAGVDFRLPTSKELDALEAFQLSLGRQEDLTLPLNLKDSSASVGQDIFINGTAGGDPTKPGGKCQTCHFNAGASNNNGGVAGTNRNFNTGVEDRPDSPTALAGTPRDGGFGIVANPAGGFGDGKFNTPPLVEAADTGPFFHNNAVNTIKEAIRHYNSDAFNNDPNSPKNLGAQIQLDPIQVGAVAAFLRVINALENIRSATDLEEDALRTGAMPRVRRAVSRAIGEVTDAINVLEAQGLHAEAVSDLRQARALLEAALVTHPPKPRNQLIQAAIEHQLAARGRIVDG